VSAKPVYTREDCGFANLTLTKGVDAGKVKAKLYAQGATTPFATLDVAHRVNAPPRATASASLRPRTTRGIPGGPRSSIPGPAAPLRHTSNASDFYTLGTKRETYGD
jgi:hypothetical protein